MPERGGYAAGRLRRDEILRAAGDVFAGHGYRGASLALIAERVGMSAPGLLHHFPTKDHLLVELLALRQQSDGERLERLVRDEGVGILDALLALAAQNAEAPGLVRLFTVLAAESVDDDHPAHEWFIGRYRRVRRQLTEYLLEERRAGRIRDEVDAELTAAQIVAMFDGLQLQWLLAPQEVDMVAALGDFLDSVRMRLSPETAR